MDNCQIIGDLDLRKPGNKTSKKQIKKSSIIIRNSIIHGSINFSNIWFLGSLDFQGTNFWGSVDFTRAKFKMNISFQDSNFYNKAVFIKTTFQGIAEFIGAKFFDTAMFDNAAFEESASFELVEFRRDGIFNLVKFESDMGISGTIFSGKSSFRGGKFRGSARFGQVTFCNNTHFTNAIFYRDVSFEASKYYGISDFNEVKFLNKVDFSDITLSGRFELNNSIFKKMEVSWEDIKKYLLENDNIYMNLKRNFKELNKPNDEDNCYLQYRKWVRKGKRRDIPWIFDKIAEYSCGYGSKPQNIFWWSLFFILLFGAIYYLNGISENNYNILIPNSSSPANFSIKSSGDNPKEVYSFYFSAMTFLGTKVITFEPPRMIWIIEVIETAVGYLSLGILISCLYRVFTRGLDR